MKIVFPSKWIKASDIGDVGDEKTLTIREVNYEGSDEKGVQYWVRFDEIEGKKWTMNITNFKTISKVLGSEDSDDWIGHKITLYVTEVEYGGETMAGVRVRLKKPGTVGKQSEQTLGEAGQEWLLGKIEELFSGGAKTATIGCLRTILAGKNPDLEGKIAGDPKTWPVSLKPEIVKWINDGALPF